jgi:hypothetical protein
MTWVGIAALAWVPGKASGSPSQAMRLQLVLFALALHADKAGVTWAGRETLAADCCCSARTISRWLGELEATGLAARVRRHDERGHRQSDYIVLAPFAEDRGDMRPVVEMWPTLAARLDEPRCNTSHLGGRESLSDRTAIPKSQKRAPKVTTGSREEVEEVKKTPPTSIVVRTRSEGQQQEEEDGDLQEKTSRGDDVDTSGGDGDATPE